MERMKSIFATGLVAVLLAVAVYTQSALTGKWQGTTPGGSEIVLDVTATEKTLTGTLTRNGEALKIMDGKVAKNTFTFKATMNDQNEGFSGEVAGDEIKIWIDLSRPRQHDGPGSASSRTQLLKLRIRSSRTGRPATVPAASARTRRAPRSVAAADPPRRGAFRRGA